MGWIVKGSGIRPILCGLLALATFCVLARADSGARAPRFTAQTLDGETVSDTSLGGRMILPAILGDMVPALPQRRGGGERIERRFAGQGLVVLAVDVGEPELKDRSYLEAHPRSCRIALDEEEALSKQFGKHGIPYYVVIDREGRIAGTQNGAAGETSLLHLLNRAGLSSHSDPSRGAAERQASAEGGGAKVIELSQAQNTVPSKPGVKTIFVLANGERLETDQYTVAEGFLHLAVGGQQRTIALNALDMKATTAANHARGVDLKIPQNRSEVLLAF